MLMGSICFSYSYQLLLIDTDEQVGIRVRSLLYVVHYYLSICGIVSPHVISYQVLYAVYVCHYAIS